MRLIQNLVPVVLMFLCGCASAPQMIEIETTPSGARVSVNNEDLGPSPVSYRAPYDHRVKSLVFRAEKPGYLESVKKLRRNGGKFGKTVYLMLERQTAGAPVQAGVPVHVNLQTGDKTNNNTTIAPNNVVPSGPVQQNSNNNNKQ